MQRTSGRFGRSAALHPSNLKDNNSSGIFYFVRTAIPEALIALGTNRVTERVLSRGAIWHGRVALSQRQLKFICFRQRAVLSEAQAAAQSLSERRRSAKQSTHMCLLGSQYLPVPHSRLAKTHKKDSDGELHGNQLYIRHTRRQRGSVACP